MSTNVANEGGSRTQFSLKSLFLFVTAAAVVFAPTYWFGPGYLVPALCSTILVALCARGYSAGSSAGSIGVSVLALVGGFFFAIVSVVFFVHAFWNVVFCGALVAAQARPKVFATTIAFVMVVVYGIAVYMGAHDLAEARSAKVRYPFESLEPRLAFERGTTVSEFRTKSPVQLASAVASNLDVQDQVRGRRSGRRAWALEQLHKQTYHDFVFSPGFGVSRMPRFRPEMVELEPPTKFRLPMAINVGSQNASLTDWYEVHRSAMSDFSSPERIGYVRSRAEVSGFNSHVLTTLRDEWSNSSEANQKWQVVRLELVSLLRHSEPRVYVAETMPAMDQLANVPNRALNEFEKGALTALVSQEDFVVRQEVTHLKMLGAVRAGTSCLECHEGERGRLLGAFSYEITPLIASEKTSALTSR